MLRCARTLPPAALAALTKPSAVNFGAGPMAMETELETPPPVSGLNAVRVPLPTAARSDAGISTVTWVLSTKILGRFSPFHRIAVPGRKFAPVKLRVAAD